MKPRPQRYLVCISLLTCLLTAAATGAEEDRDARAFIDKIFSRSSWDDMQGDLTLTLTNARGDRKVRKLAMWIRNNDRDESSMLMRFEEPADVRGTGFLHIEHNQGEDDRRLFLPALRRVQRISTSGQGGNFMASDFTYYDLGRPRTGDFTYTFSGEEPVSGIPCKVVTGHPASEKIASDTGYTKVVWRVDPNRLIVMTSTYYDKDGLKFKELEVLETQDLSGIPFATHMRMRDLTTGHQSELVFSNLKTNQGLEDAIFTERNLRKWRR